MGLGIHTGNHQAKSTLDSHHDWPVSDPGVWPVPFGELLVRLTVKVTANIIERCVPAETSSCCTLDLVMHEMAEYIMQLCTEFCIFTEKLSLLGMS